MTRKVCPFWCAKAGEKFDLSFSDREKDKKSLKWTFLIIFSRLSSREKSNFSVGRKRLRKGLEKADLSARGDHAKSLGLGLVLPKLFSTFSRPQNSDLHAVCIFVTRNSADQGIATPTTPRAMGKCPLDNPNNPAPLRSNKYNEWSLSVTARLVTTCI